LHARYSAKHRVRGENKTGFSKKKMLNLVKSLEVLVKKLKLPASKSTWFDYYGEASQRPDYLQKKQEVIRQWIEKINPISTAADIGANTGEFSKLVSANNTTVIAADFDAYCINDLYDRVKNSGQKNILPLIIDFSKPSPAIGVNNEERDSFIERVKVDLALALALIHHLVIGKNIPFDKIANLFNRIGRYLIIEFIPKQDEKIQLMLADKKDIYTDYTEANFLSAFEKYFNILEKEKLAGSGRILYLMKKHEE
jgi:ribosomal protein L11 methylase PrmA